MRTILTIPEETVRRLDRMARRIRVSRAQVIRRAVDEYLGKAAKTAGDEAFGLWRGRLEESVGEQRRLRGEWDG